jgi:hypothetical protein
VFWRQKNAYKIRNAQPQTETLTLMDKKEAKIYCLNKNCSLFEKDLPTGLALSSVRDAQESYLKKMVPIERKHRKSIIPITITIILILCELEGTIIVLIIENNKIFLWLLRQTEQLAVNLIQLYSCYSTKC